MDVQKQIDYWKKSSQEDLEAAKTLLEKGHFRHALFFAHLAIEKALKAHVTRKTCEVPPKIHNLTRLAEKAALPLELWQRDFLLAFDAHQLEGRYPDMVSALMDRTEAQAELAKAERGLQWLMSLL
ncbi:MAG: HEPN domain-containing protein [Candidatus Brocadiia bacterium]